MTDKPTAPSRHFLPWDRPLLPQAVEYITRGWAGDTPLDLSELLVVVPTRQSGRRLREALAVRAAASRQAVFAPRVCTPDLLLEPAPGTPVATPLESLLAWTSVLLDIDLDGCRALLPVDPPERNFAWALGLARTLAGLQQELAEGGLRLADVAERANEFPETERWRQLGALEQLHAARLAREGRIDAQAAKIAAARQPGPLEGISRIVLVATPDPMPLALQVLAVQAHRIPVEVVIHAAPEEAGSFDAWGRPQPDAWTTRVLALPEFEARTHLCADLAAQADWLVRMAAQYAGTEGRLAVGVADSDVLPPAESALQHAGVPVFNPEGRRRSQEGFHHLLAALAEFAGAPEYPAIATLARCPEVLAWLETKRGPEFSAAKWLEALDALHARHLPADLPAVRRHAAAPGSAFAVAPELALLGELHARLVRGRFGESVSAVMTELFAAVSPPAGEEWRETVEAWMEIVRGCAGVEDWPGGPDRAGWWRLALALHGEGRQVGEKPAGALELQGWLELPWEDAPHLVVAGLNDGRVPDAVAGDAFLPESLRVRLGLKSNEARFARDAYLLQAIVASRGRDGRVDLLFGKFAAQGDPLRPSRLLLRCPENALPARIDFLFRAPELPGPAVAWRRAWPLRIPRRAAPPRVAVTALKRWLKCPLRFYLQHVLGMAAVDPEKSEMDAFDFGTLCHGALEAMARDEVMRNCTDAGVLRDFLWREFDRLVRRRHGTELTLPLLVQQESARQRLARAAEVQAGERAEGWVIVGIERAFELPVGGMVIAGKIDRIERHERTGAWRVLDYKTSDAAVNPAKAHLRSLRPEEAVPDWARWDGAARSQVWSDLQLPLYQRVLAAEAGEAPVDCAYFNLPKASGETGLYAWVDCTPELQLSAWRCAQGVVAAIRDGVFWPPRELAGREAELDDFAPLFHGGAAASVVWEDRP